MRQSISAWICAASLAAAGVSSGAPPQTPKWFSGALCQREMDEEASRAIVAEVFEHKFDRLVSKWAGRPQAPAVFSPEFLRRNRGLRFAVCDNPGSFDTLAVYDKGVLFDAQLLGLLMAQSRALIVGGMADASNPTRIHRRLIETFLAEGATRSINPIAEVERVAGAVGIGSAQYKALLEDQSFKQREQTTFLVALNFVSLHERCHFGLGHGKRIQDSRGLPASKQSAVREAIELEADRCALSLMNADEVQFAASPSSVFGAMMTVTTQVMVSSFLRSVPAGAHPSGRERIAQARVLVLEMLNATLPTGTEKYERFKSSVLGVSDYMEALIAAASAKRSAS